LDGRAADRWEINMYGKAVITVTLSIEVDLEAEQDDYALASEEQARTQLLNDLPESLAAAIQGGRYQEITGRAYARTSDECEWFAHCHHKATALVAHPVLGHVPACRKHEKFAG
jgi:hypothetical protein